MCGILLLPASVKGHMELVRCYLFENWLMQLPKEDVIVGYGYKREKIILLKLTDANCFFFIIHSRLFTY